MFSVCYVTAPSQLVAKTIAKLLVEQHKVAACVNIIPGVQSIYVWDGKLNEDEECLMMIKTRTALVKDIISVVTANHPYDCPEVISVPMGEGSDPYLQWITKQTTTIS